MLQSAFPPFLPLNNYLLLNPYGQQETAQNYQHQSASVALDLFIYLFIANSLCLLSNTARLENLLMWLF